MRLILSFCVILSIISLANSLSLGDYARDGVLRLFNKFSSSSRIKREATYKKNLAVEVQVETQNCAEKEDEVVVSGFAVNPKPIKVPGTIYITFNLTVKQEIGKDIYVKMEVEKELKFLFGLSTWVTVPCLEVVDVGSCTYNNLCEIPLFKDGICNEDGRCGCPYEPGSYSTRPVAFELPKIPDDIPPYLMEGNFKVQAIMFRGDKDIACMSGKGRIDIAT